MPSGYDGATVLLSVLLAVAASYVGLDLAKRMRAADRGLALWWCLGGSVASGTGIWAMHFIGMLAFHLPVETGYHPVLTPLSWLAAIAVSRLALASRSCCAGATHCAAWSGRRSSSRWPSALV